MTVLDWISTAMLVTGGFFVLVGGIGAIRMPDLYTRMHASSLTDTMGSMLILGGLMIQAGWSMLALKIAVVAGFLLFTSPVAAYALANAALTAGHRPMATETLSESSSD